jgi:hypothetical protein
MESWGGDTNEPPRYPSVGSSLEELDTEELIARLRLRVAPSTRPVAMAAQGWRSGNATFFECCAPMFSGTMAKVGRSGHPKAQTTGAVTMDSDQLLEQLTIYEKLPKAAIREAMERREEMLPIFLRAIETFLADEDPVAEAPTPLFMIVHILGSWRETSAYRPVARLLMSDSERLEWSLGDAVAATVPRIMLNLFDGDAQPLRDIIACEAANEYVRSEMLSVLATLAHRGEVPKDEVARYLRDAYSALRPQREHYVWVGWECAVASLGLNELASLVDRAFDRGFIEPGVVTKRNFREDMKAALSDPDHRSLKRLRVEPWGDTIEELSIWDGLAEPGDRETVGSVDDPDLPFGDEDETTAFPPVETVTNPYRDIGRNDPCPCGSGKKFKRCCLGTRM